MRPALPQCQPRTCVVLAGPESLSKVQPIRLPRVRLPGPSYTSEHNKRLEAKPSVAGTPASFMPPERVTASHPTKPIPAGITNGHDDQFPRPRPSDCCRFSQET